MAIHLSGDRDSSQIIGALVSILSPRIEFIACFLLMFLKVNGFQRMMLLKEVARHPDTVTGGLKPTVAAIEAGKYIALANKETLIAGGPFVLPLAQKHNVKILPADSEHSAIFQCIQGLTEGALRRIILTASGGALSVCV